MVPVNVLDDTTYRVLAPTGAAKPGAAGLWGESTLARGVDVRCAGSKPGMPVAPIRGWTQASS